MKNAKSKTKTQKKTNSVRLNKPLEVAKIDYVGYNAIFATQLLIDQLKDFRTELRETRQIVSTMLSEQRRLIKKVEALLRRRK